MRRIGILCGLCLVLTDAAASGAPLSTSSSANTAVSHASATSLVARRAPQDAGDAQSTSGQHGTMKGARGREVANVMLLGNRAIESTVGDNLVGTLEGFAFRARRGGAATSISVYVDKRDRATTVYAGLYSSRHGHPQSLMTSGSRRSPKAGAWNSLDVGAAHLESRATYWLVILGKGGAIYFRDRNGRSCAGHRSSMRKMPSLLRTWPVGPNSHGCLISAFVKGIGRVSSGTGGGTQAFGTKAPAEPTTPGTGTNSSTPSSTPPTTPGAVLTLPPVVTAAPTITGSPVVGQTLTTSNGSWIDSPTSYAYEWQDCDTLGILCTNIAGAGSSSYVPVITDVGQTIRAVVTASDGSGSGSPPRLRRRPYRSRRRRRIRGCRSSRVPPSRAAR